VDFTANLLISISPKSRSNNFHFPHRRLRQNASATICRTLYSAVAMKELIFVKFMGGISAKMRTTQWFWTETFSCEQKNPD
jgi:hypothetical protein